MNDFKKRMKEKIKQFTNDKYLDGYIQKEYITDDDDADIFLTITDRDELFDSRTSGDQIDLIPDIYEFIENKSAMLANDTKLELHILGLKLTKKEQGMVKHIIKEHFAIELYKIQKEYVKVRNKIVLLFAIGFLAFSLYFSLLNRISSDFIFEVLGFIFSFALWEALDAWLYTFSEIKNEREAISQDLLMEISFENEKK